MLSRDKPADLSGKHVLYVFPIVQLSDHNLRIMMMSEALRRLRRAQRLEVYWMEWEVPCFLLPQATEPGLVTYHNPGTGIWDLGGRDH